jgi:hypothetical protein
VNACTIEKYLPREQGNSGRSSANGVVGNNTSRIESTRKIQQATYDKSIKKSSENAKTTIQQQ